MYFLIFLITELVFWFVVVRIFSRLITPPRMGRIPVGSGDERSLNQKKPSLRIAGLMS
jgi:hypothetical protein